MGMIEQLAGTLQSEHSSIHVHLLRALLILATDHQGAQQECRRPELQLVPILRYKIKNLKDKDEYQVEPKTLV